MNNKLDGTESRLTEYADERELVGNFNTPNGTLVPVPKMFTAKEMVACLNNIPQQ